jgi:hypothetical protein
MAITYTLEVAVPPDSDSTTPIVGSLEELDQAMNLRMVNSTDGYESSSELSLPLSRVPTVRSQSVKLFPTSDEGNQISDHFPWAAIFCPSTLVRSSYEKLQMNDDDSNDKSQSSVQWLENPARLSQVLLSFLNPFLAHNFAIRAIVAIDEHQMHRPGAMVILDLGHIPRAAIFDLMDSTNGQVIYSGPEAVLKLLLLQTVAFVSTERQDTRENGNQKVLPYSRFSMGDIPTCAVCLHRLDPTCLGLPPPPSHQMCSKFCPPPNLSTVHGSLVSCPRQRLLRCWPLPDRCEACQVIRSYWDKDMDDDNLTSAQANFDPLVCALCGMKETLWVCLTCGFVGCGRYSNKHAAEHHSVTAHPFCLELSTLRIWNYDKGEFAHRVDFLECPSSPPLLHPWVVRGHASIALATSVDDVHVPSSSEAADTSKAWDASTASYLPDDRRMYDYEHLMSISASSVDEKTPKKATMIGEEYEALLQSALEEQAQHYEGEITSLRATLTAQQIDQDSLTPSEALEVDKIRQQIALLRIDIERASRELLDSQAQEAGHRATSQRLLREQRVSQDLLKKIQEEAASEYELGRMQIEELEFQIDDLTANHRMMQQFSQNDDLKNSQIVGTEQAQPPKTKKGKKTRKFFRR